MLLLLRGAGQHWGWAAHQTLELLYFHREGEPVLYSLVLVVLERDDVALLRLLAPGTFAGAALQPAAFAGLFIDQPHAAQVRHEVYAHGLWAQRNRKLCERCSLQASAESRHASVF